MGKQTLEINKTALDATQQVNQTVESENVTHTRYVVVRAGVRVSDKIYDTATDSECIQELNFWKKIAKNHSYGESVGVVVYDSKLHRTW